MFTIKNEETNEVQAECYSFDKAWRTVQALFAYSGSEPLVILRGDEIVWHWKHGRTY